MHWQLVMKLYIQIRYQGRLFFPGSRGALVTLKVKYTSQLPQHKASTQLKVISFILWQPRAIAKLDVLLNDTAPT